MNPIHFFVKFQQLFLVTNMHLHPTTNWQLYKKEIPYVYLQFTIYFYYINIILIGFACYTLNIQHKITRLKIWKITPENRTKILVTACHSKFSCSCTNSDIQRKHDCQKQHWWHKTKSHTNYTQNIISTIASHNNGHTIFSTYIHSW